MLVQVTRLGLVADHRPLKAILDAAPVSYTPRTNILVHGDFYVRHLLVNPDRQLAGIIDWGDVHLGDPATDLMITHTFIPSSARIRFRQAYGSIDAITWQMARLRGLWHSLSVMIYGHDTGDPDLVRESRIGLANLASGDP
jgi:aminoglycoside phosphotransferase (APT) family kinase protein